MEYDKSLQPLLKEGQNIAKGLTCFAMDERNIPVLKHRGYSMAPQKILRCARLSDLEKLLLIDLFSYMGERGYAYPSHNYLSLMLGKKSRSSVKKALNSLQEKGFIYWEKGGGDFGTNSYMVADLYHNPYIIMSEANHFFTDLLLSKYRNKIPYEKLFGAILSYLEPPESQLNGETDFYGEYIRHLAKFPGDKDCHLLYGMYSDIAAMYLEKKLDRYILKGWGGYYFDHFLQKGMGSIEDEEFLSNFVNRREEEGKAVYDAQVFSFHHGDLIIPDWNYCYYSPRKKVVLMQ